MADVYVVMAVGYEYNDEINYRPESGGGDPIQVFYDKNLAELYVKQKNLEEYRKRFVPSKECRYYTEGLGHYAYDFQEIDCTGKLKEVLSDLGLDPDDCYEMTLPADISDDDLRKVVENCNVSFYELVAIPDTIPGEMVKWEVECRAGKKEIKV